MIFLPHLAAHGPLQCQPAAAGWQASTAAAGNTNPTNAHLAASGGEIYSSDPVNAQLRGGGIAPVGGGQPHNNVQPFQVVNFIIALVGIYPSRH